MNLNQLFAARSILKVWKSNKLINPRRVKGISRFSKFLRILYFAVSCETSLKLQGRIMSFLFSLFLTFSKSFVTLVWILFKSRNSKSCWASREVVAVETPSKSLAYSPSSFWAFPSHVKPPHNELWLSISLGTYVKLRNFLIVCIRNNQEKKNTFWSWPYKDELIADNKWSNLATNHLK